MCAPHLPLRPCTTTCRCASLQHTQVLTFWSYYRGCGYERDAMAQWVAQVRSRAGCVSQAGGASPRGAAWLCPSPACCTAHPRICSPASNALNRYSSVPPSPPSPSAELPRWLCHVRLRLAAAAPHSGSGCSGAHGRQRLARQLARCLASCHAHRRARRGSGAAAAAAAAAGGTRAGSYRSIRCGGSGHAAAAGCW